MPYVRYKDWAADGVVAKKALVGTHDYTFFDAQEGVCLIPNQRDVAFLLRLPSNLYEVAWERHGVRFDAEGQEIQESVEPPRKEPLPSSLPPPRRGRPPTRR